MMLVLSLACTLAANEYHFMQLPPIHLLSALHTSPPPLPLLISTLSMHRPPALWAWICAPATLLFYCSQYLSQRGSIWFLTYQLQQCVWIAANVSIVLLLNAASCTEDCLHIK